MRIIHVILVSLSTMKSFYSASSDISFLLDRAFSLMRESAALDLDTRRAVLLVGMPPTVKNGGES
jgi:hypothetical protein